LQKWLLEDQRDYDILCGVSVGALNVAILSQAPLGQPEAAYTRLLTLWDQVENRRIWRHWMVPYVGVLWNRSVLNSKALRKWVEQECKLEAIQASGRQVRVGAVNLNTEEIRFVGQRSELFPEFVYGSASFPFFFRPIKIKGDEWTDGGVRNVTPLGEAIRLGADEIDVVLCSVPGKGSKWKSPRWPSGLSYVPRIIDIMSTEIVLGDLRAAGLKNQLAELGESYKQVRIRLQHPAESLIDNSLNFSPSEVRRMREVGYADACRAA